MTSISATKFRNNLFEYLLRVSKGESIGIELNGKMVGKIMPLQPGDWRQKIKTKTSLNKKADKAFAPLKDVWKDYL